MTSSDNTSEAQESIDNRIVDGKYCAEVEYRNRHSGADSNYSLLVDVKDEKVNCIYWPQGGHLDSDHFNPTAIPDNGISLIKTFEGKEYSVKLIGPESTCDERFKDQLHQCKGITKEGNRCKRLTDNESGYCFQHEK